MSDPGGLLRSLVGRGGPDPEADAALGGRADAIRSILSANSGLLVRLFAIALGVLLWELYASLTPDYFFPGIGAIFEAFVEQVEEDDLIGSLGRSLYTLFAGFALGAVVGIAAGILMGVNRTAEAVFNPYVSAIYVTPISAVIPILILIGGSTFGTRVAIVFLFVVFEVLITTYEGTKSTPTAALDVARSFGAGRAFLFRKVIVPHDLPYILAGLRLGIGRGVRGLILAELLIEFVNLGAIIRVWQDQFRTAGVLSITALLMVLGIVLTVAIAKSSDRLLPWMEEAEV